MPFDLVAAASRVDRMRPHVFILWAATVVAGVRWVAALVSVLMNLDPFLLPYRSSALAFVIVASVAAFGRTRNAWQTAIELLSVLAIAGLPDIVVGLLTYNGDVVLAVGQGMIAGVVLLAFGTPLVALLIAVGRKLSDVASAARRTSRH